MRIYAAVVVLALGASSYAQMFDDITLRRMSPKWSTVLVGADSGFAQAGTHVISSYQEWQKAWPYISRGYQPGMQVPSIIDWRREQIILISLGNIGVQGYGIYVEDVRRSSQFLFDVRYVITRPSFQAGFSFSNFNFGFGTSPYVAIRVPRSYGIPNFYSRYYSAPSYVVSYGCGCLSCRRGRGHGQVWMLGAGGVLLPYVPPGQQPHTGGGHGHSGGH
ncbi:MAG: hypothetical protein IIC73_03795 [Armatimonadetes bacterium]|nr:hypothetical protein [Armatimonadota bacterium]